ncbi:growth-regulating factor 7-like isoform X2 [Prosopis cineraria]|uniref:growth-regulating factor 7-like isoform X2 n=1 Tax=Prosopis cineraria TaxID=364024 RepID=UPI00240F3AA9|nr:growth-regulating factor 7-like isoform X2 [Prosopis cineraria]
MGEFGVSDKEAAKNSSYGVVGPGVTAQKQNLEAFPSKTMIMRVDDPPLYGPSFVSGGDGDGPKTCESLTNYANHYLNAASASGAALARPLQPFHVSAATAFKSSGGMMAASLGFPFTKAQWKELERQAMIYKYMMASIPVPPHLLIPVPASRSPLDAGFNLRFSSSSDAEPGRCRRTDGKKWRCSKDVAPNHKYCERHMHRGRPRSRKLVEIQATADNNQQINGTSHDYSSLSPPTMAISHSTIRKGGCSPPFLASATTSQPHYGSSLSLDKLGVKAANFDSLASVPRGLDWMLKGDPNPMDPQWHPPMQNKRGSNRGSCCNKDASISSTHSKGPLYMNPNGVFSCEVEQHKKRSPLYLSPVGVPLENPRRVKPRAFIDAWSSAQINGSKGSSVASNDRLSLSSLDLPVGSVGVEEGTGSVRVGLGHMDSPATWAAGSTPGGPLAEVLRPSKV